MGKNNQRALESHMGVLIIHLLKWAFQEEMRRTGNNSWRRTVNVQRNEIKELLDEYPGLKNYTRDELWLQQVWKSAIHKAVKETGMNKSQFPALPEREMDKILNLDFLPERENENNILPDNSRPFFRM